MFDESDGAEPALATLSDDDLITEYLTHLATTHPDGDRFRAIGAELDRRGLDPWRRRSPPPVSR